MVFDSVFARRCLGYGCLAGTLITWISTSFLIQSIFTLSDYTKPIFIAISQSSFCSFLLLPTICRISKDGYIRWRRSEASSICSGIRYASRDFLQQDIQKSDQRTATGDSHETSLHSNDDQWFVEDHTGRIRAPHTTHADRDPYNIGLKNRDLIRIAALLSIIWFGSQTTYDAGLLHTTVPTSCVIASASIFYTYILSLILLKESFSFQVLLALGIAFAGVCLVSRDAPTVSTSPITDTWGGYILGTIAAFLYALFIVVLKLSTRDNDNVDIFFMFGSMGLFCLVSLPAVVSLSHFTGLEKFEIPNLEQTGMIALNGFIGTTLSTVLWGKAVLLLSPVVVTVVLSTQIPLSIVVDRVLLRNHSYSGLYIAGAICVGLGVLWLSLIDAVAARRDSKYARVEIDFENEVEADYDLDDIPPLPVSEGIPVRKDAYQIHVVGKPSAHIDDVPSATRSTTPAGSE